jgi:DNA ligase-1
MSRQVSGFQPGLPDSGSAYESNPDHDYELKDESMNLRIACLCLLSCLFAPSLPAAEPPVPRLMLATTYHRGADVSEYWVSEKLDGVRGRWDGSRLHTRGGQPITPPAWFTAGWPKVAMDGELWMGRNRFDETSALVRTGNPHDQGWRRVRFMVFDLPDHPGTFDVRVKRMRSLLAKTRTPWLQPVAQYQLANAAELDARLKDVVASGGEGLMLHHRNARYRIGRSDDLLKYKPFEDAEARVIAHTPGKGKYVGMLGALVVQQADGRQFRLGSGFTDVQRATPPPIGSLVTYRYNGLTSKGLPRFARFLRVRHEPAPSDPKR